MTKKNDQKEPETLEPETQEPEQKEPETKEPEPTPTDALAEALKVINEQKKQLEDSAKRTQELNEQIAVMLRNGQGVTGSDPNIKNIDKTRENNDNAGDDYVSLSDLGSEMSLKH